MADVRFINVNKIYDNNVQAVFDFNLDVKDKEFIVLVGPSGCGKSTTLRMLAGLEEISSGEIIIDGTVVNDVHPKNRDIAMVFQNYALYPHMTVYDNIAFALKLRKIKEVVVNSDGVTVERYRHYTKEEISEKVHEAAKILALEQYLDRKPKALSGGQRQRVALGRAIVRSPKVFLMDEPLSNLDAKLRIQMRSEIIRIHKKVNATTIYVTHDQTEAMTMADRIVIMKDGYIQQIGTPKEVYDNPSNMFVGGFIGAPAMNFLTCTYDNGSIAVASTNDEKPFAITLSKEKIALLEKYSEVKISDLQEGVKNIDEVLVKMDEEEKAVEKIAKTQKLARDKHREKLHSLREHYSNELNSLLSKKFEFVLGVRPENIDIVKDGGITVQCELSELLGHEQIIYSFISGQRILIKTDSKNELGAGSSFNISFREDGMHLFDVDTTRKIEL